MACHAPPSEIFLDVNVSSAPYVVTFTADQSSPGSSAYLAGQYGDLNLIALCPGVGVKIHFKLVSSVPGLSFHSDTVRTGISYSPHQYGLRRPVLSASDIGSAAISPDGQHLSFTYGDRNAYTVSGYILYLAQNNSYFGEIDPIIDNGSNTGMPP